MMIIPIFALFVEAVLTQEATTTTTVSTTTSTKLSTTTKTSPAPATPSFNISEFRYGDYCTCDLTANSCDPNCCCDPDCKEADVKAFSGCSAIAPFNPDPRYCYTHDIVAKNNTLYSMEKHQVGFKGQLFCILVDNLEEHSRYLEREAVDDLAHFEVLVEKHRAFSWLDLKDPPPEDAMDPTEPFAIDHYYVGHPIWTWNNRTETLGVLQFPGKMNQPTCQTFEPVRYMTDAEKPTVCQRQLHANQACSETPELDVNFYLEKDVLIVKSPSAYRNTTKGAQSPFVKMKYQLCTPQKILNAFDGKYETHVCVSIGPNFAVPRPTRDCKNILTRLSYEIHHEGLQGVSEVFVSIELDNLESSKSFWRQSPDLLLIHQEFSYSHLWKTDNVSQIVRYSGNPGYVLGAPVLSGVLNSRVVKPEREMKESTQWFIKTEPLHRAMTVLSDVPNGDCSLATDAHRSKIAFGQDVRTGCTFKIKRLELAKDCEQLKDQILHLLLGSPTHQGINQLGNLRIATFGNSDPQLPGDWVEVLTTRAPVDYHTSALKNDTDGGPETRSQSGTCKNMVLSLHIEIAFANIGSVANPQSKIVGVNYRFGRSTDVTFRCVGLGACKSVQKTQNLDISTSVSFLDVTQPALSYYAEYPVIKVRLPYDFFYPFVLTGSTLDETASSATRSSFSWVWTALLTFVIWIH